MCYKYQIHLQLFPYEIVLHISEFCPGPGAQLVGVLSQLVGESSCAPKGGGFHPHVGHVPRLQIQSPVWVRMGGDQLVFLSHINLSLSLKSINISSGED